MRKATGSMLWWWAIKIYCVQLSNIIMRVDWLLNSSNSIYHGQKAQHQEQAE